MEMLLPLLGIQESFVQWRKKLQVACDTSSLLQAAFIGAPSQLARLCIRSRLPMAADGLARRCMGALSSSGSILGSQLR
jgi:hypothetical protein